MPSTRLADNRFALAEPPEETFEGWVEPAGDMNQCRSIAVTDEMRAEDAAEQMRRKPPAGIRRSVVLRAADRDEHEVNELWAMLSAEERMALLQAAPEAVYEKVRRLAAGLIGKRKVA